jgi:hypothetical protein
MTLSLTARRLPPISLFIPICDMELSSGKDSIFPYRVACSATERNSILCCHLWIMNLPRWN